MKPYYLHWLLHDRKLPNSVRFGLGVNPVSFSAQYYAIYNVKMTRSQQEQHAWNLLKKHFSTH